jgi:hypothetical protein
LGARLKLPKRTHWLIPDSFRGPDSWDNGMDTEGGASVKLPVGRKLRGFNDSWQPMPWNNVMVRMLASPAILFTVARPKGWLH